MAFRFQIGKQHSLSLIIKDHVIRFSEIKTNPELQIQRLEERFLPPSLISEGKIQDPETLGGILEECAETWKLKNKPLSILVPDPYIVMRKINIPADIKEDEIKGYLFMELGTSIHLPFEDPIFDFHLIDDSKDSQREILLFAAPEEIITDYTDVLEEAKLKPAAADVSALALYRLFYKLDHANQNENLMMIQFDVTTVNVSIFENHTPVFMRHLKLDVDPLKWEYFKADKELEWSLHYTGDGFDIQNSLLDSYKEIDRVKDFYQYSLSQGNKQVTKIVIDGDHPWLEDIYAAMKERNNVPVTKLNNSAMQMSGKVANISPFHLNIGLGLKEV